jgi:hypothetical protein
MQGTSSEPILPSSRTSKLEGAVERGLRGTALPTVRTTPYYGTLVRRSGPYVLGK